MPIVSPRCSFGPPVLRTTSPWVNAHAIWRVKSLNSLRETTLPVGKSIKASPSGSYLSPAPRRWVHILQSGMVTEGTVDVWMRGTIVEGGANDQILPTTSHLGGTPLRSTQVHPGTRYLRDATCGGCGSYPGSHGRPHGHRGGMAGHRRER